MKCKIKYKQIIDYVREHYGYSVQTCVIASVLRELGFETRRAWNSCTARNPKIPTERDRLVIKEAIDSLSQ